MGNRVNRIIEDVVRDVLNESSLNRVLSWIRHYDIACVTAYRNEFANSTEKTLDDRPQELKNRDKGNGIQKPFDKTPYKYTRREKEARNRDLKAYLLKLGYGVTNIKGNYIENLGTINAVELGENSFFVVNLNNDDKFKQNIFELSEYYNQDCFLYKPRGCDNAYNIGTNQSEYPGYGNEDNLGKLHINIENEFLSCIGNSSFAFTNSDVTKQDNKEYNFQTRKQNRINGIKETMNLSVYEDYKRGSRMSINSIYERIGKHIMEMKRTSNNDY